ncbi:MAG TPA: HD domain-containing phosphohydrolase [Limnochordia bacterium]|nr:HD domain-containing phosphohydrolase [Limnochordia bacterium]
MGVWTIYTKFITLSVLLFSLSEAVFDAQGSLVDYRLIKVNPVLEKLVFFDESEALGKHMSEWLFKAEKIPDSWLQTFSSLHEGAEDARLEELLELNGRWYLITAFLSQPGHLVMLLHDVRGFQKVQLELKRRQANLEGSLESSQDFSQRVFENNPSAIVIYKVIGDGTSGDDYIIQSANPVALEIEGWRKEDVLNQPLGLIRPGVEGFGILDTFQHVWKTGETAHYPANVYRENQEHRWFENIVFKLNTGEIVAVYSDVTETKNAELALFAEKEKFKVTLYSIGDAVITTDMQGNVELLNPVAETLTGWTQETAIGQPLTKVFDIYNEVTGEPCENPVEKVLQTGEIVGLANHTVLKAKDGTQRAIDDSAAPIRSEQGELLGVVLVFRDVTETKEREARIAYLTFRDSLTGLYNRTFFEEEYKRLDNEAFYPLTLIMGDLDGLKLMNDAFGHHIGDEVLNKMADIIRSCCRKTDIVSRWGGDEFVILLPNTTEGQGERICEKIKVLAAGTQVADTKLRISLGCAAKLCHVESRGEILRRAENNMFKSKLLGAKSYRSVVLDSIKRTLFEKSCETEEHGRRMGEACRQVGEALRISATELDELEVFSMLHDIGKIGIAEHILLKPGPLTPDEWTIMKTHPEIGYRIASTVPELINIADYILAHHERWDGKGYPKGLAGEEIPLLARILAVVDAYDAMTQSRPYREALSSFDAMEELRKHAGTQFDPKIVGLFLELLDQEGELKV